MNVTMRLSARTTESHKFVSLTAAIRTLAGGGAGGECPAGWTARRRPVHRAHGTFAAATTVWLLH